MQLHFHIVQVLTAVPDMYMVVAWVSCTSSHSHADIDQLGMTIQGLTVQDAVTNAILCMCCKN